MEPEPTKTEAIKATPPPQNVSDLGSFLGTCGNVAKFILSYANIDESLTQLTRERNRSGSGEKSRLSHPKPQRNQCLANRSWCVSI